MCTNWIFRSIAQARKCREVNSGPLSQRSASGLVRFAMIPSNSRVTRHRQLEWEQPTQDPGCKSNLGHLSLLILSLELRKWYSLIVRPQ